VFDTSEYQLEQHSHTSRALSTCQLSMGQVWSFLTWLHSWGKWAGGVLDGDILQRTDLSMWSAGTNLSYWMTLTLLLMWWLFVQRGGSNVDPYRVTLMGMSYDMLVVRKQQTATTTP
jgi:hypothetical protein